MFSKSLLTLSRPYAEAVFKFACQHKSLEKWELMLICAKKITSHPMIVQLLSAVDCIEPIELSDIFITISQHQFDCFGQNFIRVLADYKRLYLIPHILDQFLVMRKQKEGILTVEITTSISLNNEEILQIISIMEKQFSCNVNILHKIDSVIIGGIILRINNFVIDGSIQGRIKYLKRILETEEGNRDNAIKYH